MTVHLYSDWLEKQKIGLTGETLRRFEKGHAHNEKLFAESIWLPAVGSFDYLSAEYEVRSYTDGYYYLDFVYMRPPFMLNFEVDDFSSHARNISLSTYEYNCDRQNQLNLDEWITFRFNLDAIRERPRKCQKFILLTLGKLYGSASADSTVPLSLKQREIIRLALRLQRPFSPAEVCEALGIRTQHARQLLHGLVALELLAPASGDIRIRLYVATPKAKYLYLP